MSTAATINTNEGWTFANNDQNSPMTDPDNEWGAAAQATTIDGWDAPPPAPLPPHFTVGQPCPDNYASLHWTACYDDDYSTHRQIKDYNYYLQWSSGQHRHRRNHQRYDCPMPHPHKLIKVCQEQHLDPIKACADWH